MKKCILFILIAFLAVSCNKRVPITGEQFKYLIQQQGFEVVQLVGQKDAEIGITAKYSVVDSASSDPEMEIMFFEFIGTEQAKSSFNLFRSETQRTLQTSFEYGSPNNSGAFGNTQEYFAFTTRGENVNVIRVINTLAYSYTTTSYSRKTAEKLFETIGYKDMQADKSQ